ncbi:MAG: recombination mediator RecR [Acidobacteriota bacterium]|jgi:recombination protein RecR|nr:recombination mediator RecR [Acidobacteriota bacterium]
MVDYTPPLARLIDELKKIPGIGRKSAQRIAFFLLRTDKKNALALAEAIAQAREKIFTCSVCNNITAVDPCEICSSPERDREKICVVEEPFNIHSIERTGLYHGLYHVLMGNLSPIRGIGPDELRIAGLVARVRAGGVQEVILATSPTTEGSATAHYLTEILRQYKIIISRIALGLPVGADLDYADEVTIAKAMEGRLEVK